MSDSERVVIRSSWLATLVNFGPVGVVLLGVEIWERSLGGTVFMLFFTMGITSFFRYINYVELTPDGLGNHWFRMTRVPWSQVGSVDRLGSFELKIFDLSLNSGRHLAAPRGAFGVGKKEITETRDLIDQWWVAHRGTPPPVPARPMPRDEASGPPVDPWAPPPEG